MAQKKCKECGGKHYSKGLCSKHYHHAYRRKNPEKIKSISKKYRDSVYGRTQDGLRRIRGLEAYRHRARVRRWAKFGASQEDFKRLELQQNGQCAICNKTSSGKRLCFDHDHKSNSPRGLLCNKCNVMVGYLENSPELFSAAMRYVETHKKERGPLREE